VKLRTYEQAVAWAEKQIAYGDNASNNWKHLCQKFAHYAVNSSIFGAIPPGSNSPTALTAWEWAVSHGYSKTDGPPPAGSLAYYGYSGTGHAVFATDGGMVYSTPYGNNSPTGTNYSPGKASWKSFSGYRGYITAVPDGPLDIRTTSSSGGSSTPPRTPPSDSSSGQLPTAEVDPPAYAVGPGNSTTNSRIDMSAPWVPDNRPVRYNPPLVRSAMHNEGFGPAATTFYNNGEVLESGGGALGLPGGAAQMGRLGRIVTEDYVPQEVANKGDSRYGFRFLYNPSSYAENIQVNTAVDPQVAAQDLSNSLSANASFSFSLYLNRIEDLRYTSYPGTAAYPLAVSQSDWNGIQEFGTLWDVEYLMRTVNGAPKDTWRGNTAEFGQMYGLPSRFYLGRGRRLRGRLMSVTLNHLMFSRSMVPILTEVQVGVMRYPDTLFDVGATATFIDPNTDPVNTAHSANDPAIRVANVIKTLADPNTAWPPTNVQTPGN
jgi:hypothetical protein